MKLCPLDLSVRYYYIIYLIYQFFLSVSISILASFIRKLLFSTRIMLAFPGHSENFNRSITSDEQFLVRNLYIRNVIRIPEKLQSISYRIILPATTKIHLECESASIAYIDTKVKLL